MNKNNAVIVGMSGGVDSSVAALLLKQQGFQVTGVFMKNWEEDDDPANNYCTATQDLYDAQQVCDKLKIDLLKVNFSAEYWDQVFSVFLNEYQNGRTPNPDILCNKEIKFKVFLDYAKQLNSPLIATGHYARLDQKNYHTLLLTAIDQKKDQSYFLHALTEDQLRNCLFPLGNLTKTEIRKTAKDAGFLNHNKKDSTGICFIGERKFKNFLAKYLLPKPGKIVNENLEELGTHEGVIYYTIGQRKGLNIGGLAKYHDLHEPWYVINKDLNNNILIVAKGKNNPQLYSKQLIASNVHWINPDLLNNQVTFTCQAKIRYRQPSQLCVITAIDSKSNNNLKLLVTFEEPQRAITPGQYVVFYDYQRCLGGAIIQQAI